VRRGSGYMHIVALTYQPEFTVIEIRRVDGSVHHMQHIRGIALYAL